MKLSNNQVINECDNQLNNYASNIKGEDKSSWHQGYLIILEWIELFLKANRLKYLLGFLPCFLSTGNIGRLGFTNSSRLPKARKSA